MRNNDLSVLCTKALELGIESDYVRVLIRKRHLLPTASATHLEVWPWPVKVYTFGRFAVAKDGSPITFTGKTQKRPLDLLKIVIAFGGREVSQTRIIDALWPEADGDSAIAAFNMALKRLREMLGHPDAVLLSERKFTLNFQLCWVDVWVFERAISHTQPTAADLVLSLYHGPFLGDDEQAWSISIRERLHASFVEHVQVVGKELEASGDWAKAAHWYQRGLRPNDLVEQFYQRLMVCQYQLGHRAEVLATYQRCKKVLQIHLQIAPSATTEKLYRTISA